MVPQTRKDIWLDPVIRDVLRAENWLHVTEDVTMWGAILSVELTWDLKGSINLHEVKTGRSPGCPVAGLWHSLGLQRPRGETNTHLSLLLRSFPFSFLLFYSVSLRPTICLPCLLSFALTSPQTEHGSLVYSQMERGGRRAHHLLFCATLLVCKAT